MDVDLRRFSAIDSFLLISSLFSIIPRFEQEFLVGTIE